jgi:Ca2+-binding EF-hand superfamily protein
MIDQDGDGVISEADLKGIFGSLGNSGFPTAWTFVSHYNTQA